jgi:hypothetical protein
MELMATRVTLKAINDELTKRGHNARVEKASGYFYFMGGEATDWIERTVPAGTVGADGGSVDRRVQAAEEAERGDHERQGGAEAGLTPSALLFVLGRCRVRPSELRDCKLKILATSRLLFQPVPAIRQWGICMATAFSTVTVYPLYVCLVARTPARYSTGK